MIVIDKLKEKFFLWKTDLSDLEETELTEDVQLSVLSATLASPLCAKFPPRLEFRLAFCKKLIQAVEAKVGTAVAESLYEMLARLQKEPTNDPAYRTYFINEHSVSLKETVEIIRYFFHSESVVL
jgi:hypothetical protein